MSVSLKRFLFVIGVIQGIALGHSVYADTVDKPITSYKNNNTTYSQNLRIMYGNPIMINSMDNNGTINYLWETEVTIAIPFPMDNGNYYQFSTMSIPFTWSTNATVYQAELAEINNTDNINISLYNYLVSGGTRTITANLRIYSDNIYYRNSSSATLNIASFKVKIWTTTNITPVLTFGNVSSYIQFYSGLTQEQVILNALNNANSATDIANILTLVRADNVLLQRISNILGANYNLETVQEYSYRIWDILNKAYPSQASEAMDDAEDQFNNISESLQEYELNKPNYEIINEDVEAGFINQTSDFNSSNIFFYYNWEWILGILIMVIGIAIISYVLYGGK